MYAWRLVRRSLDWECLRRIPMYRSFRRVASFAVAVLEGAKRVGHLSSHEVSHCDPPRLRASLYL